MFNNILTCLWQLLIKIIKYIQFGFKLILVVVLLFLLVGLACTIITIVATHLCLIFGKGPLQACRLLPDILLEFLFQNNMTQLKEPQYQAIISDMIAAFAFIVTMATVFQVWLYRRKIWRKFRHESGIHTTAINKKGEDDIKWMLKHYKKADTVTIFAGSFEWLGFNKKMKSEITKLAKEGNLCLISRKTKTEIQNIFNNDINFYNILSGRFRYESKLCDVTCTMIKNAGRPSKFLFRSNTTETNKAFNACVFLNTKQSEQLLYILSKLTENEHWGIP